MSSLRKSNQYFLMFVWCEIQGAIFDDTGSRLRGWSCTYGRGDSWFKKSLAAKDPPVTNIAWTSSSKIHPAPGFCVGWEAMVLYRHMIIPFSNILILLEINSAMYCVISTAVAYLRSSDAFRSIIWWDSVSVQISSWQHSQMIRSTVWWSIGRPVPVTAGEAPLGIDRPDQRPKKSWISIDIYRCLARSRKAVDIYNYLRISVKCGS
jgi:hypothetical protein